MTRLSSATRLGRILRLPLRLIGPERVVRVVSGPIKGSRWVVGSAVHGCWLGIYESKKSRAFASAVRPGDVVFDVGANAGYYTLIAARAGGPNGKVHAFEPLPENASFIERHVALNGLTGTVEVHRTAVTDGAHSEVPFAVGENRSVGSVEAGGSLTVPAVSLDDFVSGQGHPAPDVMKIDVEDGEADVLEGCPRLLTEGRPKIFLATHGREVEARCLALLSDAGYSCITLGEWEWICE